MTLSNIRIFSSTDGKIALDVSLNNDTVWLSIDQMSELFDRDKSVISRHIRNIFKEAELERVSVVAKNATTASDGKVYQVDYFNLDVIISVGYRVKSHRGLQFRQWATNTLKEHLIKGYTLNQQRLKERGIKFEQALSLLSQTLSNQQFIKPEGEAVVSVINDYARSWSLLQSYDEQSLKEKTNTQTNMHALQLDDILVAVEQLKHDLIKKGEATELFGQLRGNGLASAVATIEQGFGDEWFYPNVASRAAHLLYLVIKNHPFADGNKRTGAFLFLWYLRLNESLLAKPVEQLINDNTLVALALLVAESKPDQKELMTRLIEHFILLSTNNETPH